MRLNRQFQRRGQAALIVAALILFCTGYLADEKAAAVLNLLFALCIFGIVLLEILCRRRRPGQRIWNRRTRMVIGCAGAYCLVFAAQAVLVLAGVALPGAVKLALSLLSLASLVALVIYDYTPPQKRWKS